MLYVVRCGRRRRLDGVTQGSLMSAPRPPVVRFQKADYRSDSCPFTDLLHVGCARQKIWLLGHVDETELLLLTSTNAVFSQSINLSASWIGTKEKSFTKVTNLLKAPLSPILLFNPRITRFFKVGFS